MWQIEKEKSSAQEQGGAGMKLVDMATFAEQNELSYHKLYRWVRKCGLPHVLIDGKRYIRQSDYEKWIETKVTVSIVEPKAKTALREIADMPLPKRGQRVKMPRIY
ncbi:MAG: helix-turn-helix domain-containing protein [Bacteroidales bacterium]|nr:helix-turn-helix domain-containing protein [Bacteroidales bacterium]MBQ8809559.1 helix-turn-helix domain-containing protein [Bacteroidales bacterium]